MSLRAARRRESVHVPNISLGEDGLTAEEEYKNRLLRWVIIIDHPAATHARETKEMAQGAWDWGNRQLPAIPHPTGLDAGRGPRPPY